MMRSDEFQSDSKQRKLQAKPALPGVKEVEGSKDWPVPVKYTEWKIFLPMELRKENARGGIGNLLSADRATGRRPNRTR